MRIGTACAWLPLAILVHDLLRWVKTCAWEVEVGVYCIVGNLVGVEEGTGQSHQAFLCDGLCPKFPVPLLLYDCEPRGVLSSGS